MLYTSCCILHTPCACTYDNLLASQDVFIRSYIRLMSTAQLDRSRSPTMPCILLVSYMFLGGSCSYTELDSQLQGIDFVSKECVCLYVYVCVYYIVVASNLDIMRRQPDAHSTHAHAVYASAHAYGIRGITFASLVPRPLLLI